MLDRGVYPASVTAFDSEGRIDLPGMARLLAHFEAEGCKGVVLAGTNGEGPSLSAVEKRDLVRAMMPVRGSLQIIAGIASNSLEEAVWLCNQAHKDGAAAGLVMAPSYFREATEEGICAWFEALFSRIQLPILVYNFPQRTGITLTSEMISRLAKHERFAGLKDSSGNAENLATYRAATTTDHVLFVGNETLLLDALDQGWTGTISGAANVVARWLVQVMDEGSQTKFELIRPVLEAIRQAPQPATHKVILRLLGIMSHSALRLPLLDVPSEAVAQVQGALQTLGVRPQ